MLFKNRIIEINDLKQYFESKKFEFLIIYGRRRIGKTSLMLHLTQNMKFIYSLGEKINNLHLFYNNALEIIPEIGNLKEDYRILFDYLKDKVEVIVLDEFQNLVLEDKNILNILQSLVDLKLNKSSLKLVLIGSSISLMKSHVLADPSPLYGRKTASLKLTAMSFFDLYHFFPKKSIVELMEIYGFADGIPYYLEIIDNECPFWVWLAQEIKRPSSFLKTELDFLMRYEFLKPEMYMRILEAIALGNCQLNEIATKLALKTTDLTPYITLLIEVEFIKKERPFGENLNSRHGRYFLKDNFLKFWFRFVFPYLSQVEQGIYPIKKIQDQYPSYLGFIFENVAAQYLNRSKIIQFAELGRWWWKDIEIDLLAFDDQNEILTLIECKWQDEINAHSIIKMLAEKAPFIPKKRKKDQYMVFAKSFKSKIIEYEKKRVYCIDCQDLDVFIHK